MNDLQLAVPQPVNPNGLGLVQETGEIWIAEVGNFGVNDGGIEFVERRFAPDGSASGTSRFAL